jgi:CRISPR-associated Cas5-like protein
MSDSQNTEILELFLHIKAPFASFRPFQSGSYRSTTPVPSPSAVYGILLNIAGIEQRTEFTAPITLIRDDLPEIEIAIAQIYQAESKTETAILSQQLLLYISYSRLPNDTITDEACPVPPDLVIEIISPDQTFAQMTEKATDYLNAGVLRVWVVDAKAKAITIFYPDAPPQTKRGNDSLADFFLEGLQLTPQQIFQQAGIP